MGEIPGGWIAGSSVLGEKGSGSTRQRISKVKAELSVTRILEKIAFEVLAIQEDL